MLVFLFSLIGPALSFSFPVAWLSIFHFPSSIPYSPFLHPISSNYSGLALQADSDSVVRDFNLNIKLTDLSGIRRYMRQRWAIAVSRPWYRYICLVPVLWGMCKSPVGTEWPPKSHCLMVFRNGRGCERKGLIFAINVFLQWFGNSIMCF